MANVQIDSGLLTPLLTALTSDSVPHPSPAFLAPILTPPSSLSASSGSGSSNASTAISNARTPSLNSLIATTKHRLLAQDLTAPDLLTSSVASLPPAALDVTRSNFTLSHDTPVQVLDIEDLGTSRWEQVLELEAERKGERTKGREIIRVADEQPDEHEAGHELASSRRDGQPPPGGTAVGATSTSHGPFKLLLQDKDGIHISGFELARHARIGFPPTMGIGCKLVLKKGCKVARGMVLLEPATVVVLGGKIERLEKAWLEGREERLRKLLSQSQGVDGRGDD